MALLALALRVEMSRKPLRKAVPLPARSTKELVLDGAFGGGSPEVIAEFRSRGDSAVHEAVATLHGCPLTKSERARLPEENPCCELAIGGFFGLVGRLGGIEARDELRRWLTTPVADRRLRKLAAVMLANAFHDRESVPGMVELLSLPPEYDENAPIYGALREMPAPETAGAIRAALLHRGPDGLATSVGLRTLGSFPTEEAQDALRAFLTSEGPDWRLAAIRAWDVPWFEPMPPLVRHECISALGSGDIEMRQRACRALAGARERPRTPDLYTRLGSNPCEQIERADVVAKIVEIEMARPGPYD